MAGRRVLILGTSHAYALIHAIDGGVKNIYSHKLVADFSGKHNVATGDPPVLKDDVAAWVNSSLDADYVLLPLSSANWLEYCISNRDAKFDLILPFAPDIPEVAGAQVIPFAEMRRELINKIREFLRGIEAMRNHIPRHIPIWYVAPPPPLEDNERLREMARFAEAEIARYGVTDPNLRLKVYLLHSEILAETCAATGVRFLPAPRTALNERGFLPADCIGSDCFHANARYGWHVIRDVERLIDAEL